jgi:predicted  nucleic acid-binding Zn-ribbon protein
MEAALKQLQQAVYSAEGKLERIEDSLGNQKQVQDIEILQKELPKVTKELQGMKQQVRELSSQIRNVLEENQILLEQLKNLYKS